MAGPQDLGFIDPTTLSAQPDQSMLAQTLRQRPRQVLQPDAYSSRGDNPWQQANTDYTSIGGRNASPEFRRLFASIYGLTPEEYQLRLDNVANANRAR